MHALCELIREIPEKNIARIERMYLHLVADNSGKYVRRMFCKLYSIHIRMHCVDKCHHKYIRIYEPYVTQIQIYRKKKAC